MLKTALSAMLLSFTTIALGALSAPTLSTPISGVTLKSFEAGLYVRSVTNATGYQFQYDTVITFNSGLMRQDTSSQTFIFTQTLLKGKKYYWRARAFRPGDTSSWSGINNLTIFTKFELFQPPNNTSGTVKGLTCGPAGNYTLPIYVFEVDTTLNFNSPLHVIRNQSTRLFIDTPLFKFGNTLYWRATAISSLGDTLDWSETYKYSIYVQPTIYSNSSFVDPKLIISWPTMDLAEVVVQMDTSANFTSSRLTEKILAPGTLRDTLKDLMFGDKYYYRIRAKYDTFLSNWTIVKSFTVYATESITNPSYHGTANNLIINFTWRDMDGTMIQFQLATDTGYSQLMKDTLLTGTNYLYPDTFDLNTYYYMRIRFMHAKDTTPWVTNYFHTYTGQVNLGAPSSNQQNVNVRPQFAFIAQKWADSHMLEVDTGTSFGSLHSPYYININSFTSGSFYTTVDTTLRYGQNYVWRVSAIRGTDTGEASTPYIFKTTANPTLYFPPNNFIGIGTSTNGLITGIKGSAFVQWELDTTLLFNSAEYATGIDEHVADDFDPNHIVLNFPKDRLFKTAYYWRATCINIVDTSDWSPAFLFNTTTDVVITNPVNGSVNVPLKPSLQWSVQGSASDYRYQYQLSTDSNFSIKPITTLPQDESAIVTVTCNYGTKYYWRARATHSRDTSGWSAIAWFTTINAPVISPPVLLFPPANATNIPLTPVTLAWSTIQNATTYDVQVASDANFSSVVANANTPGTGALFSGIQPSSRYYWRVRGKMDDLPGTWSVARWFESVLAVGLSETVADIQLSIYPNPAKDELNIASQKSFTIAVYDTKGTCVYQNNNEQTTIKIDTKEWKQGLYIVRITNEENVLSQKLIIGE
jgi:hypothetical protein